MVFENANVMGLQDAGLVCYIRGQYPLVKLPPSHEVITNGRQIHSFHNKRKMKKSLDSWYQNQQKWEIKQEKVQGWAKQS